MGLVFDLLLPLSLRSFLGKPPPQNKTFFLGKTPQDKISVKVFLRSGFKPPFRINPKLLFV